MRISINQSYVILAQLRKSSKKKKRHTANCCSVGGKTYKAQRAISPDSISSLLISGCIGDLFMDYIFDEYI
jgi:hypothetical protein